MKRPAVFLDRDNTLIASDGYLGDPAKVVLIRGAAELIVKARHLGYAVVGRLQSVGDRPGHVQRGGYRCGECPPG